MKKIFYKSRYYRDFLKNGLKSNFLEKIVKRFPCKKWRKFFIGDFHVKLKVSFEFFTRDFPGKKIEWKKFLKGFLWKIEAGFTPALVLKLSLILAIDLLPPCLWMKWKWKWKWSEVKVKWSESIFGPLNLFIFGYVKGGVLGNNNIGGKKCHTNLISGHDMIPIRAGPQAGL